MTFHWISNCEQLGSLTDAIASGQPVAIDTEFVRTDTFYARLGLVQIETGGEIFLVDALEPQVMAVLGDGFRRASRPHWLIHAGAEDLEVLKTEWADVSPTVFDTQIAAAFVGHARQASLQSLLAAELGVQISKDETRSDWCRRPLSGSQCAYAALDVAHLSALAASLSDKLGKLERTAWCDEECERLVDRSRTPAPDPEALYLGFHEAWQLSDASLSVLKALAAWRERIARQLDRPRGFILKDPALFRIAETLPRSAQSVATAPGIQPAQIRRYASAILEIVAGTAVSHDLPRPPRPLDAEQRRQVKVLRGVVDEMATRTGLPADLLATRKWLEELVRLPEVPDVLPGIWGSWRAGLLQQTLVSTLRKERTAGAS